MICFLNGDEMKSISLVLFAVILLTSCGEEKPAEEVNAPSFPVDTLEITGYIGEELGDSTNTFGVLSDAEYHENTGNILILDAGATCIKEYSPDGQYLRQISRRGSGPGELSITTFDFFQMGGNLLALNIMKQGFVVFDDSLKFLEEILLWPQNPPMHSVAVSDSTFASYKLDFINDNTGNFVLFRRIAIYTYAAEEYDLVLWEDSTELSIDDLIGNSSMLINDFLLGLTLGGNRDMILFSLKEPEEYTVHAWYPDGSEAFTISMPLAPVPKSEEEIAEEKAFMEGLFSRMGAQDFGEFDPEPYRDMVIRVSIGPDGNIWVQRGTMEQPFFDIFDLEGNLIGHRVFRETGWTWQFSLGPMGILAWEDDPEAGYQQLFLVE